MHTLEGSISTARVHIHYLAGSDGGMHMSVSAMPLLCRLQKCFTHSGMAGFSGLWSGCPNTRSGKVQYSISILGRAPSLFNSFESRGSHLRIPARADACKDYCR